MPVSCIKLENWLKHVVTAGIDTRARTNVGTFKCSFVYVTFVSRFFAPKHFLIVFMPDYVQILYKR